MGKKALLAMVLVAFVTVSAFAVPDFRWSVGGGVFFEYTSGGFSGYRGVWADGDWVWEPGTVDISYSMAGAFVFLDATFVKLSVGWGFGRGEIYHLPEIIVGLDFGLLGRYPVLIDNRLTVFPLFGINFAYSHFVRVPGRITGHVRTSFQLGGGLDFFGTGNVFLRGQALYGFSPRHWNSWRLWWWGWYENISSSHSFTIKFSVGHQLERRQRFFEWD